MKYLISVALSLLFFVGLFAQVPVDLVRKLDCDKKEKWELKLLKLCKCASIDYVTVGGFASNCVSLTNDVAYVDASCLSAEPSEIVQATNGQVYQANVIQAVGTYSDGSICTANIGLQLKNCTSFSDNCSDCKDYIEALIAAKCSYEVAESSGQDVFGTLYQEGDNLIIFGTDTFCLPDKPTIAAAAAGAPGEDSFGNSYGVGDSLLVINNVTYCTTCANDEYAFPSFAEAPGQAMNGPYDQGATIITFPNGQVVCVEKSACDLFDYYACENITNTFWNREWNIGPAAPELTLQAFDAVTANFDFSVPPNIDTDWSDFLTDDTNTNDNIQDVQIIEGYVKVINPITMRWFGASRGFFALDVGECCGPYDRKITGFAYDDTADPTSSYTFNPGVHSIRMWNVDDWSSSIRKLEYSFDGVTWIQGNFPPDVYISRDKITEEVKNGYICEGSYFEIDKTTPVVFDDLTTLDSNHCQ